MANSCVSSGSSGGCFRQGSIGFKKISGLTDDLKKTEHDLIKIMRIAKAKSAVVQAKIAALATSVVARLNDTRKVAKERALATSRYRKHSALKILIQRPTLPKDRATGARTDL